MKRHRYPDKIPTVHIQPSGDRRRPIKTYNLGPIVAALFGVLLILLITIFVLAVAR